MLTLLMVVIAPIKVANKLVAPLIIIPWPATVPGSSDQAGDEWPMYRGALNHTGVGATGPVGSAGVLWNFTTGGGKWAITSSPAVAGGLVYVGSDDNHTYCLNASTGMQVWNFSTGGHVESSPAIAGGYAYFGSDDGNVYCLDARTGDFIWNYTTYQYFPEPYPPQVAAVPSSPAVAGGCVFVGNEGGNIYCLNCSNGNQVWNSSAGGSSSPAVVGEDVYFVGAFQDMGGHSSKRMVCVDSGTGASLWNSTTPIGIGMNDPVLAGGRAYIGGNNDIYCLDAMTGDIIWTYATAGQILSSPAAAGGCIYASGQVTVQGNSDIYCLDAVTGNLRWSYGIGLGGHSSPVVAGEFIYITSGDGILYCLNASTGGLSWSLPFDTSGIDSSPAVSNGDIYIGSDNGLIFCIGGLPSMPPFNLLSVVLVVSVLVGVSVVLVVAVFARRRRQIR